MTNSEARPPRRYPTVLRQRSFLLLWTGSAVSTLGDHFYEIALMWFTFARTRSSLEVAGIAVVSQLTYVVIGPAAGVFSDRWDRRRTMMVSDLMRAGLLGAFAAYTWTVGFAFPLALVVVFLEAAVGRFFGPSRSAYVSSLVERRDLVTANGLMTGAQQAMGLGGQAVAGVAVTALGAVSGFVIDAASFVFSALALGLIRVRPPPDGEAPSEDRATIEKRAFWPELRAGWEVIRRTPVIRALTLYAAAGNALFAMVLPAMPAYVHDELHTGAWAYGLVGSFQFGGGLVAGFLAGGIARRLRAGHLMVGVQGVTGASLLVIGVFHLLPAALVLWALWGFMLAVMGIVERALEQSLIPMAYLARVLATMSSIGMALMPVGSLVGGFLANQIGPGDLYGLIGGADILMAGAMWANRTVREAHIAGEPEQASSR